MAKFVNKTALTNSATNCYHLDCTDTSCRNEKDTLGIKDMEMGSGLFDSPTLKYRPAYIHFQ